MNQKALHQQQRIDALGCAEEALDAVRRVILTAPSCGPLVVGAYRALGVLGELRETIDALPEVTKGEPT